MGPGVCSAAAPLLYLAGALMVTVAAPHIAPGALAERLFQHRHWQVPKDVLASVMRPHARSRRAMPPGRHLPLLMPCS
jgi:hypothetical protein